MRNDINKITEEAVQRVQTQSKQAKQIAQQIKKDKAINNQLANFLSFLMKTLDQEKLIQAIVDAFFKTTNPKNQITYLRKDINTYVVVGFFTPFFQKTAEKYHIWSFYDSLGAGEASASLGNYIEYLGKISMKYHDNVPIDQSALLHLIVLIAQHWLKASPDYSIAKEQIVQSLYK